MQVLYHLSGYVSVPVRLEFRKVTVKVNDVWNIVTQVSSLKKENEDLKIENSQLLEKFAGFEETQAENQALKDQLDIDIPGIGGTIGGRVVGFDIATENSLQINLGTNDGVEVGDIVIYGQYAIGKVQRAEGNFSKILLITASSNNIPARGQSNRALGLVGGDVGPRLKMIDILPDEKVEVGEVIVTSGLDSEYPAGLILGVVESIDDNPANATQEAFISTKLDFSKLDYIYVIDGQKK
jgi:rod shape-determining protein MreC